MTSSSDATTTNTPTRPALKAIQHVGLTVTDIEASILWYQRVLGLERKFEEPHRGSDQGGHALVLGTADMSLNVGLECHPGNQNERFDETRTGLDHLCFQVESPESLHSWAEHLATENVTNSGVYAMDGMPISLLTFRDPDGIQLEMLAFHA